MLCIGRYGALGRVPNTCLVGGEGRKEDIQAVTFLNIVVAIMAGVLGEALPGTQGYLPGPEARVAFRSRAGTRKRTGTGKDRHGVLLFHKRRQWQL
jgi:hypothetical protein